MFPDSYQHLSYHFIICAAVAVFEATFVTNTATKHRSSNRTNRIDSSICTNRAREAVFEGSPIRFNNSLFERSEPE